MYVMNRWNTQHQNMKYEMLYEDYRNNVEDRVSTLGALWRNIE